MVEDATLEIVSFEAFLTEKHEPGQTPKSRKHVEARCIYMPLRSLNKTTGGL